MRTEKILSLILALAMILTLVTVPAFAEGEAVAQIGDVEYATIEDAITAANKGDIINIVAKEIELPKITKAGLIFKSTVEGKTKVTNKIETTNSDYGWRIEGTTFDGFEFTQQFGLIGKDITVLNCDFTGKSGLYYAAASGTWTIDNCVLNPTWAYGISVGDGNGTINISNSVVTSWNSFSSGYEVNFDNCVFKKGASNYSVLRTYNKMTITNSTFEESWTETGSNCYFDTANVENGIIEISNTEFKPGNIFKYVDDKGIYVLDPTKNDDGLYTGGQFAAEPAANLIAEGYASVKNADGTYTVKKAELKLPENITEVTDGNGQTEVLEKDAAIKIEKEGLLKNATIDATEGKVVIGEKEISGGAIVFDEAGKYDVAQDSQIKVVEDKKVSFMEKTEVPEESEYSITVSDGEKSVNVIFNISDVLQGNAKFVLNITEVPAGTTLFVVE